MQSISMKEFSPRAPLSAVLLERLRRERRAVWPHEDADDGRMTIASYNVHKCIGMDKRYDPGRVTQVIAEIGADVIALQEADRRFGDREGTLDLYELERHCGLMPVPLSPTAKGHGWHGNMVLVREARVRDIHQMNLPGVEPRGAVMVDMDLDHGPLRLIAAHFGLLRRCRRRQARAILETALERDPRPTIFVGDLNEWRRGPGSALHALDPLFGPLSAALPSFPSRFPMLPLDRILARPHHIISRIEVHDTPLARMASDHLPLKARVDLGRGIDLLDGATGGSRAVA